MRARLRQTMVAYSSPVKCGMISTLKGASTGWVASRITSAKEQYSRHFFIVRTVSSGLIEVTAQRVTSGSVRGIELRIDMLIALPRDYQVLYFAADVIRVVFLDVS